MAKKCIYCNSGISDDSVIDVCQRCGIGVWGEKMFNAIVGNMESARDSGDLFQGSVAESASNIVEKSQQEVRHSTTQTQNQTPSDSQQESISGPLSGIVNDAISSNEQKQEELTQEQESSQIVQNDYDNTQKAESSEEFSNTEFIRL